MAKFKAVPQPRSEEEFVQKAEAPRAHLAPMEPPSDSNPVDDERYPWRALDPKAPPTVNQTVRLNAYQHAKLQYLATLEERSQAQILRRLLGPALDAATNR